MKFTPKRWESTPRILNRIFSLDQHLQTFPYSPVRWRGPSRRRFRRDPLAIGIFGRGSASPARRSAGWWMRCGTCVSSWDWNAWQICSTWRDLQCKRSTLKSTISAAERCDCIVNYSDIGHFYMLHTDDRKTVRVYGTFGFRLLQPGQIFVRRSLWGCFNGRIYGRSLRTHRHFQFNHWNACVVKAIPNTQFDGIHNRQSDIDKSVVIKTALASSIYICMYTHSLAFYWPRRVEWFPLCCFLKRFDGDLIWFGFWLPVFVFGMFKGNTAADWCFYRPYCFFRKYFSAETAFNPVEPNGCQPASPTPLGIVYLSRAIQFLRLSVECLLMPDIYIAAEWSPRMSVSAQPKYQRKWLLPCSFMGLNLGDLQGPRKFEDGRRWQLRSGNPVGQYCCC